MQVQELVGIIPWTFIAQICNLFIQMYLIKRFLFKPVHEILKKRRAAADAEITQAEEAKAKAEAIRAEYEQNMQDARQKANEILDGARKTAAIQSEKILKEAQEQSSAMKKKAEKEIDDIITMIQEETKLPEFPSYDKVKFECNVSEKEYEDIVEKTKEYIRDGDIFQAVISRRFVSPYEGSLIQPYRVLRTTNSSPYMVYMNLDDVEIMSTSPETLVRLQDGRLTTFPVAGSRPRGKDEAEDEALVKDLLSDEKELSEHNMLVDLGRNDLGRIAEFGTVDVTKYMMIHKYSKIMHICSQVEADIRSDADALDAVKSVLPAGTLSGAPKIRACEIIDELESEPRGIYGGALGYLDFSGNLDTCIAIRMAVKKDGKVYVQAGGGIVADSRPRLEYEESGNKARAVIDAIQNAGKDMTGGLMI